MVFFLIYICEVRLMSHWPLLALLNIKTGSLPVQRQKKKNESTQIDMMVHVVKSVLSFKRNDD